MKKRQFRRAKKAIDVSPGESVRIMRELQELSQNELSNLTGIPQSTISAIENQRVNLGVAPGRPGFPGMGYRQGDGSLIRIRSHVSTGYSHRLPAAS